MLRERSLWFMIGLFILSSLACNAFAGGTEPSVNPPPIVTSPADDEPTIGSGGVAPTVTTVGDVTGVPDREKGRVALQS